MLISFLWSTFHKTWAYRTCRPLSDRIDCLWFCRLPSKIVSIYMAVDTSLTHTDYENKSHESMMRRQATKFKLWFQFDNIHHATFWSFLWKTFLDGRPKPHVCKFHDIPDKSEFRLRNLQIQISDLYPWIYESKSKDFIRVHKFHWNLQISMKSSHLSDLNRKTSNNERPLAEKGTPVFVIFHQIHQNNQLLKLKLEWIMQFPL